jgi:hypothetical protein
MKNQQKEPPEQVPKPHFRGRRIITRDMSDVAELIEA